MGVALRTITERLATELHSPQVSPPEWTEFEWRVAQAVASMHGVSALFSRQLRWQGPEFWQTFLRDQEAQTGLRHERISQVIEQIDDLAREAGLTVVGLKGAALIELGICDGRLRPRADIDLLALAESEAASMRYLLARIGYYETYSTRRHCVLCRKQTDTLVGLGENVKNPVKIELHTQVAEHLPISEVDITATLLPRCRRPGLAGYPSLAALMRHLLLHAAGNMRANALRLVQLYDIAQLAPHLKNSDWIDLVRHESAWSIAPPLMLTDRYFPGVIAPSIMREARALCPRLLDLKAANYRLSDVSWSQLRIFAFPGIEWSRSVHEALTFMLSRLWPSKEAFLELQATTRSTPWVDATPWYGQSHLWRIARWVLSRPPRAQTMQSVQSALDTRNVSSTCSN